MDERPVEKKVVHKMATAPVKETKKEKENTRVAPNDQRKGYGKVPKYLQRFAKEKEEKLAK